MAQDARTARRASFEAIRWNGTDVAEIEVFVDGRCTRRGAELLVPRAPGGAPELVVPAGGWIVRGVDGLHVLDEAYEPAHEPSGDAHATEVVAEVLAFEGGFD